MASLVVKRGDLTQRWPGTESCRRPGPGLWQGAFVATGTGVEFSATVTYEEDKADVADPGADAAGRSGCVEAPPDPAEVSAERNKTWSGSGAAVLEAALAWTPEGLERNGSADVARWGG